MWALQFFVYALIVWLLVTAFGGTMIGYYFTKKAEFEAAKARNFVDALKKKAEELGKNSQA